MHGSPNSFSSSDNKKNIILKNKYMQALKIVRVTYNVYRNEKIPDLI